MKNVSLVCELVLRKGRGIVASANHQFCITEQFREDESTYEESVRSCCQVPEKCVELELEQLG